MKKIYYSDYKNIVLMGNPNVGKSTLFNRLTGLNQHTGNWAGKTVDNASGYFNYKEISYHIVDLPGTYSLDANSSDEKVACDYLLNNDIDYIVIVVDSTSLERNLNLVIQTINKNICGKIVIAINLMDVALKKGINIDLDILSKNLGYPCIGISARNNDGISLLLDTIYNYNEDRFCNIINSPKDIFNRSCNFNNDYIIKNIKIDRILTSKKYGFPIMLLTFGIILWITIVGANYPSNLLEKLLFSFYDRLFILFESLKINPVLTDFFLNGIYKVVAWVISVMLPPMAIFFPLFSILEDLGYLPRIAFNFDKLFKKFGAHGKQSLTMCMGYGCNVCGVSGCRIIESKKERLIAILTNVFSPCNGRFPSLIAIISIFLVSKCSNIFAGSILSSLILLLVIIFSILVTLLVSKILSITILKGEDSSFSLELPPFRKPNIIKTIINSIFERTLFVLGRALYITIPAGIIIWLLSNISLNGNSILYYLTNFFEPIGRLMGLDGTIIIAFILGIAANEIVIPIMLMAYSQTGVLVNYNSLSELGNLLLMNNWTIITAISFLIFSICHFPCGTTILTIKKETNSFKWTIMSIIIPLLTGVCLCVFVSNILKLFI